MDKHAEVLSPRPPDVRDAFRNAEKNASKENLARRISGFDQKGIPSGIELREGPPDVMKLIKTGLGEGREDLVTVVAELGSKNQNPEYRIKVLARKGNELLRVSYGKNGQVEDVTSLGLCNIQQAERIGVYEWNNLPGVPNRNKTEGLLEALDLEKTANRVLEALPQGSSRMFEQPALVSKLAELQITEGKIPESEIKVAEPVAA